MDADEFDPLMQARPFTTQDAMQWDARLRRCASLGQALWGKTPDDLKPQLLAPHPEIPAGFDLEDFRELLRSVEDISAALVKARGGDPRFAWLPPRHSSPFPTISIGAQHFTEWEARCEIVRRAIEYLEEH